MVVLAKDNSAKARREALQKGAYLYLTQPISGETLDLVLRNSVERARLRAENSALKEKVVFDDWASFPVGSVLSEVCGD